MIPYRVRSTLRKFAIAALVLLLIAAGVLLCWLLWLNRYVLYTRDGALLDFDLPMEFPQGQLAEPPAPGETIDIYYNEGANVITPESTELTQLSGFYVSGEMLAENFDAVESALKALPTGTPVLLDVKNVRGEFYYTTNLGPGATSVDPARMDKLITYLQQTNHYLIARVPALRDYWFGLNNVDNGIFNPNRWSLWMDADRCYWLNPLADGTLTYLIQIATELRLLGFDEVVFTDFAIPDTQAIYFPDDRVTAINDTAAKLVSVCSTDAFAVSFCNSADTFTLPEGRSRLYLENVAAAQAAGIAQRTGLADPEIRLVFLTDLMDTRFDSYGAMRPLKID